jgi:hypothetical protein
MVKSKRSRSNHRAPSTEEATELARAIQALGDFAHVTVRAERGYLHVFAGDEEPIARLTPLPGDQFGLSFHSHTGRWEPMPVAGDLVQVAQDLVDSLGIYLAKPDFHLGKSGSDH